jgi:3',5'-cyclic AMP phosphodiesterase CpdA
VARGGRAVGLSETGDSKLQPRRGFNPDAVAVSGDLTQRCTDSEFVRAREFLDSIRRIARTIVVPGNHDIRWLAAGPDTSIRAHNFKYSRYFWHISKELNPSLELPGAVIAGLNTAHGLSRESLTHWLRDLGVIGYVKKKDLGKIEAAFERAAPDATRIVMTHHNPVKGPISGRHGLAHAQEALDAFGKLGVELVLCGHDH